MKHYYHLICKKKEINYQIEQEKKKIHKELVKQNKTIFYLLDAAVIVAILLNIGALAITNAMVVKEEPTTAFTEVNVIAADVGGYVPHPQSFALFNMLLMKIFSYTIIILMYGYLRFFAYTQSMLNTLYLFVVMLFVMSFYDFLNNFGFYMGKMIFT